MLEINSLMYLGSVGIITALSQICKKWVTDARWYPILAMGFGILINLIIGARVGQDTTTSIFAGLIAGLMASGIYSVTQTEEPPKPPAQPGEAP